jgi:hypothetical protein
MLVEQPGGALAYSAFKRDKDRLDAKMSAGGRIRLHAANRAELKDRARRTRWSRDQGKEW